MIDLNETRSMSRRHFLATSAKLTLGLSLLTPADIFAQKSSANSICFYHTHTGEQFQLSHLRPNCPASVKRRLYAFLRDFRTGDTHPIDFRLMDILHKIELETGKRGVYEVISGYRSLVTNERLRKKSTGVAKKSFHLKGRAIDVRHTTISTADLRDAACSLRAGGVGYYARSNFIHLDTGRVRSW